MSPDIDYQAINEQVEASIKKEKNLAKFLLFVVNLATYILFLVLAWHLFIHAGGSLPTLQEVTNIPGIPKPVSNPMTSALLMMSIGWGIAVLMHGSTLLMDTRFGERSIRDRAMGRAMRRAMAQAQSDAAKAAEKPKGMMRLTDDGELEAIDDVMEVEVPIQQHGKG